MVATLDTLSPTYVGADRISLEVDTSSEPLQPFKPITINIDYTDGGEAGIHVPIETIVQPGGDKGGDAYGYHYKVHRRTPPDTITFTVPSAGLYLVVVREIHHNRWQGRLEINVEGDQFGEDIERTR